jgi:hypothetical protein
MYYTPALGTKRKIVRMFKGLLIKKQPFFFDCRCLFVEGRGSSQKPVD